MPKFNSFPTRFVPGEGMRLKMKISWIKSIKDEDSFRLVKNMGFKVVELENLEDTDKKIKELVDEEYKTIFVTNEVAGFSESIIKKYYKNSEVKILITPSKK